MYLIFAKALISRKIKMIWFDVGVRGWNDKTQLDYNGIGQLTNETASQFKLVSDMVARPRKTRLHFIAMAYMMYDLYRCVENFKAEI